MCLCLWSYVCIGCEPDGVCGCLLSGPCTFTSINVKALIGDWICGFVLSAKSKSGFAYKMAVHFNDYEGISTLLGGRIAAMGVWFPAINTVKLPEFRKETRLISVALWHEQKEWEWRWEELNSYLTKKYIYCIQESEVDAKAKKLSHFNYRLIRFGLKKHRATIALQLETPFLVLKSHTKQWTSHQPDIQEPSHTNSKIHKLTCLT